MKRIQVLIVVGASIFLVWGLVSLMNNPGPYGEPSIPSFSLENVCFAQEDDTLECPWRTPESVP